MTLAGKAMLKPSLSSGSLGKRAITMRIEAKTRIISNIGCTCLVLGNVAEMLQKDCGIGSRTHSSSGIMLPPFKTLQYSPLCSMDVSCTRKAPSIRWRGIESVLSSPPQISIQWAVIVKHAFMHLECQMCS